MQQEALHKVPYDVVFMDPPRAGSDHTFLDSLIKMSPKTVVYISCNPETLARDLDYLTKNSDYKILEAQPVDMFPHTAHIECVVRISKWYKFFEFARYTFVCDISLMRYVPYGTIIYIISQANEMSLYRILKKNISHLH